jgi:LAO/AO transport system kinase
MADHAVDTLLARLFTKDRAALARLLSLAAQGEHLPEILHALPAATKPSRVVAFTGSGGVGKSSLVGRLIPVIRSARLSVAVLACDPQSSVTGGALLGDRFRMGSAIDDGIFIRSLAAPGGRGAVAEHLDVMIRLLETFGFDVVLLETVGAGQGDVAARDLADAVVLLLQPEAGDDIQWEKAGILELADVVVVHKADLPTAEQTAAQVRMALDLSMATHGRPVLRVSSQRNQGHAELWQTLAALPLRRGARSDGDALLRWTQAWLARRFAALDREATPEWQTLAATWRTLPEAEVARRLLAMLVPGPG